MFTIKLVSVQALYIYRYFKVSRNIYMYLIRFPGFVFQNALFHNSCHKWEPEHFPINSTKCDWAPFGKYLFISSSEPWHKKTLEFLTRSYTNRAVQPKKMAKCFKFLDLPVGSIGFVLHVSM